MAFEVAADFAQLEQVARGKQSGLGPGRVEQRGGVAFGKNEAVVVVVFRILRIVTHVAEKQRGHQVRHGATGGGVAAARSGGRRNRVDSQLVRDSLQQFNVSFNHGARRLREVPPEAKNEKMDNGLPGFSQEQWRKVPNAECWRSRFKLAPAGAAWRATNCWQAGALQENFFNSPSNRCLTTLRCGEAAASAVRRSLCWTNQFQLSRNISSFE